MRQRSLGADGRSPPQGASSVRPEVEALDGEWLARRAASVGQHEVWFRLAAGRLRRRCAGTRELELGVPALVLPVPRQQIRLDDLRHNVHDVRRSRYQRLQVDLCFPPAIAVDHDRDQEHHHETPRGQGTPRHTLPVVPLLITHCRGSSYRISTCMASSP
jgi:hypothetical protein